MKPRIVVVDGSKRGQVVDLSGALEITIGRDPANTVVLEDKAV